MSLLDDYDRPSPRTLPVVLLLDCSGSMRADDKIGVLNDSVREMTGKLLEADAGLGCITLSLVAFGGDEARVLHSHRPIAEVSFMPLTAQGRTPLGAAFRAAHDLIEDPSHLPTRSYRPTIALISDGIPDPGDEWKGRLGELLTSERAGKATRFALAVGEDADRDMLTQFTGGTPPHEAGEAAEIRKFLQFVTTKVTEATRTAVRGDEVEAESDRPDSILRLTDTDAF